VTSATEGRGILIPVFFRAPHGGLHAHVADQVTFAHMCGLRPIVVCPPGPWAQSMASRARVITDDFTDIDALADRVRNEPFELIHAHPGKARMLAFALTAARRVPLVVTYHGPRPETLTAADPLVDIAVVVSDFTRRYVIRKTDVEPGKLWVIPNAIDTDSFHPPAQRKPSSGPPSILIATRLDPDKEFVTSILSECLHLAAADAQWHGVNWRICGDGEARDSIQSACEYLNAKVGRQASTLLGWCTPEQLAAEMRSADVVMAPGRSALEGIASGVPTVALGSKGYVGFLAGEGLLTGLDCNFGGGGIGRAKYQPGQALIDLKVAMSRRDDAQLLSAYAAIARSRTMDAVAQRHQLVWDLAGSLPRR
jgi:glycosyltransferase involved in cell wall biosynthesis